MATSDTQRTDSKYNITLHYMFDKKMYIFLVATDIHVTPRTPRTCKI